MGVYIAWGSRVDIWAFRVLQLFCLIQVKYDYLVYIKWLKAVFLLQNWLDSSWRVHGRGFCISCVLCAFSLFSWCITLRRTVRWNLRTDKWSSLIFFLLHSVNKALCCHITFKLITGTDFDLNPGWGQIGRSYTAYIQMFLLYRMIF